MAHGGGHRASALTDFAILGKSLLETLSAQAERTDGNWARATAARCMGLLTEPFDDHFTRALEIHSRMPTPF